MKRILLLTIMMALSLCTCAQTKKVAVWETKCSDGSASAMQMLIVRGGMETAVSNAPGYVGFNRTDFDAILREHNFQRSGAVSDADIKRMGEMAGVQYIIVPEVSAQGSDFYIIVKMLDVESGEFGAAYEELCTTSSADIKRACAKLGEKLFGASSVTSDVIWTWKTLLAKVTTNANGTTDDGAKHKGDTDKPGLVLQYQPGGYLYCGGYGYGADTTIGMFVAADGYEIANCPGGWVHTGKYKDGVKSGEGFVYGRDGQLIYYGNFENDAPTDSYPGSYPDLSAISFNIMMMADGTIYTGEFLNDNSEGMGLYMWPDGDAWFGFWEDGKQNGTGIQMNYDGSYIYGIWKDGEYAMSIEEAEKKRQEEEAERIRKEKESITWQTRVINLINNAKSKQVLPDGSERIGDAVNGYCIQLCGTDLLYCGQISDGLWDGKGMCLTFYYGDLHYAREKAKILTNARAYVGDWKKGYKHGKDNYIYNFSGDLIFHGKWLKDYYADNYPLPIQADYETKMANASNNPYKFNGISGDNPGDKYIGELLFYNGRLYKHGWGLLLREDGSAVYQYWYYDKRKENGDALIFESDGSYRVIPK